MRRDPLGKVNWAETLGPFNEKFFRYQALRWALGMPTHSGRAEDLQIQTKIYLQITIRAMKKIKHSDNRGLVQEVGR